MTDGKTPTIAGAQDGAPAAPPTARTLAAAVAPHLPGWQLEREADQEETESWRAVLVRPDGAAIIFRVTTWGKAELEIHGRGPKYPDGRMFVGRVSKIGCNPTRPAASIAKDIATRLLPRYLAEYAYGVQYIEERTREEARAHELGDRLAAALGDEPRKTHANRVTVHLGERAAPAYGHIEIIAGEEPHISMRLSSLSVAQAERIVQALSGETRSTAADACARDGETAAQLSRGSASRTKP